MRLSQLTGSTCNRAFNIGEFQDGKPQQILPPSLAEHEAEIEVFERCCRNLMLKILTLFGVGLEVPTQSLLFSLSLSYSSITSPQPPTPQSLHFLHQPTLPRPLPN
jgi:hypothetical protein